VKRAAIRRLNPAIPEEALANAFCHRDYSIGGGSISLGVYDGLLEIASTGTLHFGLTPEANQCNYREPTPTHENKVLSLYVVQHRLEHGYPGSLREESRSSFQCGEAR